MANVAKVYMCVILALKLIISSNTRILERGQVFFLFAGVAKSGTDLCQIKNGITSYISRLL